MADDDSKTAPPADEVKTEEPAKGTPDLGDAGKKAISEERAARKSAEKAQADLAARLKQFEDRDKTDTQRLTEERDALKAERDLSRVEATRLRLGIRYKLGEDDLDFIGAGSDDEMESRAKRYSERVAAAVAPPARGAVDQGVKGDPPSSKPDMNALIRAAARGGDSF